MTDDGERKLRLREASYLHSSSRDALIEHVFVAEVLQEAWFAREQLVDVLRSEVDAAGYDVVFECGTILRHVQLKASESGGKTSRQTINTRLSEKPGAASFGLSTANGSQTIASTSRICGSPGIPVNPSRI